MVAIAPEKVHDIIRHNPHEMVAIAPEKVHDCELHEGERGVVGSVVSWHFTYGTYHMTYLFLPEF
ncbi:putative Bet v I/Major latex protein [Helianthus anomalus]